MITESDLFSLFCVGQEITIDEKSGFWIARPEIAKDTKFYVQARAGGILIVIPLPFTIMLRKFHVYVTYARLVKIPSLAFTNPGVMSAFVRFSLHNRCVTDTIKGDIENITNEDFDFLVEAVDDYVVDEGPDHP